VEGVHNGVLSHPVLARIQRRYLNKPEVKALDAAFRKAWGTLRRLDREVEDPDNYDAEANAWIPT
jgi:hypothetical protein